MQQQVGINLMCPEHNQQIISVSLTETGQTKMLCIKCLTKNQISIEELASELTHLRQQKVENLIQQGQYREKRLGKLKKLFFTIKAQFTQQIDIIMNFIDNQIKEMNQSINSECELLKQPTQNLNITQVSAYVSELKKKIKVDEDLDKNKDEKLRNEMVSKYVEVVKQQNKLIKQECDWKKEKVVTNRDDSDLDFERLLQKFQNDVLKEIETPYTRCDLEKVLEEFQKRIDFLEKKSQKQRENQNILQEVLKQ